MQLAIWPKQPTLLVSILLSLIASLVCSTSQSPAPTLASNSDDLDSSYSKSAPQATSRHTSQRKQNQNTATSGQSRQVRGAHRQAQAELTHSASMRIETLPTKRPQNGLQAAQPASGNSKPKKFKSSHKSQAFNGADSSSSNFTSSSSPTARSLSLYDSNNNNNQPSNPNDINNNSIQTQPDWRRNIDSVNGTIDLSQYQQNDVDRLYGDALLVYFKNFNETLPAKRETYTINGTRVSHIPIYRSEPQSSSDK